VRFCSFVVWFGCAKHHASREPGTSQSTTAHTGERRGEERREAGLGLGRVLVAAFGFVRVGVRLVVSCGCEWGGPMDLARGPPVTLLVVVGVKCVVWVMSCVKAPSLPLSSQIKV
jgi:hypothetical protein